jgi:hypothetical protein
MKTWAKIPLEHSMSELHRGQLMPLDTTGSIATRFRAFADTLARSGVLEAFRSYACADEAGSVFILAALVRQKTAVGGGTKEPGWYPMQGTLTYLKSDERGSGQPGEHGWPSITRWHYYCRFNLEYFSTSLCSLFLLR